MTANAGYHVYNTGDVLTSAQVQYNLQNQTVMYFATTTARDTALSGKVVEGMVSYTPATGLMYYNGSAWSAVGATASVGLAAITSNTFSAASSVSIDNCFTSTYQNYRIELATASSGNYEIGMKLRSGGTDNTASTYSIINMGLNNSGSTDNTINFNSNSFKWLFNTTTTPYGAIGFDIFSPKLSEVTRLSGTSMGLQSNFAGVRGMTVNGFFDNSTSFDGFTIYPAGGTMTGTVRVYGYVN
jgi:hypothetical protein